MASGDPPSALARLAEKAARAFEAGDYAEARRCVGDLELEARVGGNPRARNASNRRSRRVQGQNPEIEEEDEEEDPEEDSGPVPDPTGTSNPKP